MSSTALIITALAALVVVLGALWSKYYGGFMPEPYRSRKCQGAAWKQAFPNADKQDVRSLLGIFVQSFAFRDDQKLKLAPADRILDVYRSLYPRSGGIDGLELETLALKVERTYKISLAVCWKPELTFGELFALLHQAERRQGSDA